MLAFSAWVAKHVLWSSPAIFKGWISSLLVYSFMCRKKKKEIKEGKKKSVRQHASFGSTGKILRVTSYLFCSMKSESQSAKKEEYHRDLWVKSKEVCQQKRRFPVKKFQAILLQLQVSWQQSTSHALQLLRSSLLPRSLKDNILRLWTLF